MQYEQYVYQLENQLFYSLPRAHLTNRPVVSSSKNSYL